MLNRLGGRMHASVADSLIPPILAETLRADVLVTGAVSGEAIGAIVPEDAGRVRTDPHRPAGGPPPVGLSWRHPFDPAAAG